MSKREYCFWIIPAGETSQVKKVRISVWKLSALFAFASCFLAILLFIAVDYLRVQGLSGKNYTLWRNTTSQRNSLRGEKDDLRAKLASFVAASGAREVLDSELEAKLDELSQFIGEAKAIPTNKIALKNSKAKRSRGIEELEKAIGGLEKDCTSGGCDLFEQDLMIADGQDNQDEAARATYNPERLFGSQKGQGQLEKLNESLRVLRALPLLVPVQGDLSSGFGFRWSPFEHGVVMHEGLDFAADEGTAIGSAGDGKVVDVKRTSTYGLVIDIEHTPRISTRYAHLSSALVTPGEKVMRGDFLGQVGSTGHSTGPHLHYEVILDGKQVDPKSYLALTEKLSKLLSR